MAKILYVDADSERTLLFRERLGQSGHFVTVVTSAERAMIEVDREGDYDAVVAHLVLPGIDGAELCRWLQRWSPVPAAPRVVFTSPDTSLRLNLHRRLPAWLPADRYLHNVGDIEEIVRAVESVLRPPGSEQPTVKT
jgi:CheY-like chemotaxis protein